MDGLMDFYWHRVILGEKPGDCWEWMGSHVNGYAYLYSPEPPKMRRVTRFLWEQAHGQIEPKAIILHSCDNRGCVNPEHLRIGTQRDNMRDMASKGRSLIGERNPHAKLTESEVLEMRGLRADGWKLIPLAERYGIDFATVSQICRRGSWKHL